MSAELSAASAAKVPVTVLTGFLGSGKTTLLNYILSADHGKKIAVIENEFGEVGIDDLLVKKKFESDEEIIEMMNGCICCTVRQDLIEVLVKLAKRQAAGKLKLDGIVIETTGMADPAPVAQTFFVDEQVKSFARLDGIVTLVDAKHVEQHLDEEKPEGAENEAVEQVAFADRLLLNKTDLVSEEDLARVEKRLKAINSNAPIHRCHQAAVSVDSVLNIGAFDLNRTLEMDPEFLNTDGEHEHDTSVSSVSITQKGELDLALIEDWVGKMLREKGADIYRMKGVLSIQHAGQRFVYHAVHMIFNGEFMEPWAADEERENKLVFIGKNLDAAALREDFAKCLASPENLEKKRKELRFAVGERVLCNVENKWTEGTISELMWRSDDMDPGMVAPYQITLDDGEIVSAPADEDHLVRRASSGGAAKKARTE
jgi:G3E family GTPase